VPETTYEHIVIGKGLMGAAAARHLSAARQRVALIGPEEPAERATHQGVFGSHYDEGRITRILDPDPIWALLAQRSIARYRDIEARSGVPFYYETGHLAVGPAPQTADDYVARVQAVGNDLGVVYDTCTDAALAEQFPYLAFAPGSVGMYQPDTSGHVSPRAQVRAQATIAGQQGTRLIAETVQSVSQSGPYVEVRTDAGNLYRAAQVLIATGGFSNTRQLLPRPLVMDVYARTIVLMELNATDLERLRGMPSIIYKPHNPHERCYILPPIQYPNGNYYIKIGGSPHDNTLTSLDELGDWFRSRGRDAAAQHLSAMLHAIVPGLQPVSVHTESCVTSLTPSGQLYADKLPGGRIGILTGGNGSAAKSADEIGRLGACMMQHEDWQYDIAAAHFQAQFVNS
jgi:sarcosine oxidase